MSNKHDREVVQGISVAHAVDGHVGKMFDSSYDAQAFPAGAVGSKGNCDLPTSLAFDSPYDKPVRMAGNVDHPAGGRGEAVAEFAPGGSAEAVQGFATGGRSEAVQGFADSSAKKEDFLSSVGDAIEHAFGIDKPDRPEMAMPVARAYPVSYPLSEG